MARSDDADTPSPDAAAPSPDAALDSAALDSVALINRFRVGFHRDRLREVREGGLDVLGEGRVLYRCAQTGRTVVTRTLYMGPRTEGPIDAFIERLTRDWWRPGETFSGEHAGLDLRPLAGLYAMYLPEVGFDYSIEYAADSEQAADAEERSGGPIGAWRMNGRGQVDQLQLPSDAGMFRDQTGTFYDLRAGWRWLVEQHAATGRLAVAEVQAGYVVGVRAGVPGDTDPSAREDPELEAAFSRFDVGRFDTLEFLGGADAAGYPFVGELYGEWLGSAAAAVEAGTVELFALADASEFLATIEDMAKHRGIAVEWVDPEGDIRVALHAGPLRVEMDFAYPWLRTLHTGRTLTEGVLDFYQPMAITLEEAHGLYRLAEEHFADGDYRLSVEDGVVLVVADEAGLPVARGSLIDMVGRSLEDGSNRQGLLFDILGYDPETQRFDPRPLELDTCPVCGAPGRVGKVIRPKALLGVDPRMLAGMEIGQHVVYYTLECPLHVTPIEPTPGVELTDLEAEYRKGLQRASEKALLVRQLPEADDALLMVGAEFGSLVLEPARIRAALEALGERSPGKRFAYAFFKDALVIAREPLKGARLRAARLASLEAVQQARLVDTWPLDCARPVDLDVPPAGSFEMTP